jgi:hypothetical protein
VNEYHNVPLALQGIGSPPSLVEQLGVIVEENGAPIVCASSKSSFAGGTHGVGDGVAVPQPPQYSIGIFSIGHAVGVGVGGTISRLNEMGLVVQHPSSWM